MSYLDPPPMPAPVVVVKDVGGLVTDYQSRTALYRAQNREVRLHECRSACTLALSLPNVCVYPSSQLKFHQAYNDITKEVDLGVTQELWSAYPQAVRDRLQFLTRQYKVIRGSELIAMGVRNCNGPAQQPKVLVAKASPQAAPASSDFLKGVQTALSGAMTTGPGAASSAPPSAPPRQQQAALPPVPKPPIRPEDQLHGQFEAPMPAPRPSSLGVAIAPIGAAKPLPQAEITKDIPAYLRPIPGSAPTLEPRFISLQAALRKLNPQK